MPIPKDLELIATQEASLQFDGFSEGSAWSLGTRLRNMALGGKFPLVVDIRRAQQLLFFCALPGATPDNAEWARRKSNVVARFHRSSYGFGLELLHKGTTLHERFGLPLTDFAAHGGGFPLKVKNVGVIGSVTISGLPQREDHNLVVEALCGELQLDFAKFQLPDPD